MYLREYKYPRLKTTVLDDEVANLNLLFIFIRVLIFALIHMQIEISILNEPAATRTWLSLSESTEEFFMWTVCHCEPPTLTTRTWHCCMLLAFPHIQGTLDTDVMNIFNTKDYSYKSHIKKQIFYSIRTHGTGTEDI